MKRILIFLSVFSLLLPLELSAQEARAWKRGTAVVLFSAVGGAVLGLSTLSFYGEPQKHTSNMTTGMFLGLAAGAGYGIWKGSQREEPSWVFDVEPSKAEVAYRYRF